MSLKGETTNPAGPSHGIAVERLLSDLPSLLLILVYLTKYQAALLLLEFIFTFRSEP
jgi:hypothetical protein